MKSSVITPIYKKKQLDVNDLSSYRPISQLPLTTKILERHVAMTMRRYLDDHGINYMFQRAYRPNHSTETALVKIFNDISLALGTGKKVVLCLLDLSAAFDTLKHSVLIDRLREIGLQDKALEWFQSYLSDRRMAVKIKEHVSELQVVKYGVPQGSVLGPMLFNVYCLPLTTLIRKYGVSYHVYADDTQVYVECDKNDSSSAYATLYACINDIKEWLSSNFLLLNDKKTELIEYNSNGLNQNNHLVIGNTVIDTQTCVTNLGCVLDVGLVMSGHAARMCKSAYHHLRCIRKIRNCIPMEACKLLVHSLVTSRLDYSNALLCGARDDVIKQLERVQRIAARLVCKKYTNDHSSVTELLWGLHWLPIKARVQYKILLLVYKALNTGTPPYLAAMLTRKSFCRVTRTSHKVNILNVPAHGKGRHSMKAFSVVGPTMWNELLTNELRECTSVDVFKKKLKTHLFHLHY